MRGQPRRPDPTGPATPTTRCAVAPGRTTCRRTSTRPRRCEARWVPRRGMSGRRVRGALAKGGCPHRATREWEGQEGAGAQVAEGGQAAQEELSPAAQLDVRKNVRGPVHSAKLLRNPFYCQKGPKAILATRLAPPHKVSSRPGQLPTRKTRRTSFPRRHKRLPQSWGADKPKRPNSKDSGTSPCSATLFGPSKHWGAART